MNRENINAEEALTAFNRARDAFNSQRFDEFVDAVEICESYFKAKDIDSYIMLQDHLIGRNRQILVERHEYWSL